MDKFKISEADFMSIDARLDSLSKDVAIEDDEYDKEPEPSSDEDDGWDDGDW